jgi:CHAT domain-containing protein
LTQGFFDVALQETDQGYRGTERHDQIWNWKFRILKAEVYLRQGHPQQTVDVLAEHPPPDSPLEVSARRLILQGEALCRLNRPREAESAIHDVERGIPPTRRDLQAELAFTRGRCAHANDRAAAMKYYRTAADLAYGGNSFVEASSLINLGLLMLQDQDCVHAIQELNKALSATNSPFLKEKTLGNLAECHAELGDWRQSISLAEEAEKLAARIKNDGDRKTWLIDLGRAHLALREFSKADPYFEEALAIAKERGDQGGIARCLNDLTELALKRHDLDTAEKYWKEESPMNLGPEGRAYVSFDAAIIAREHKEFPKAEQSLKDVLGVKTNESLRLTAERELGIVYWQENKLGEANRMFREAINNAETVISHLPPEHRMSFLDMDGFYDSYMRFLADTGKPFEALSIAERGRAQILSQAFGDAGKRSAALNLATIRAVLRKHKQVVLVYALTDEESFLWVITPALFKLFQLPSHKLLRPQIDAYLQEVVNHPRGIEDSPGGQELYKTLIQPAESLIPKGSRVVVISSKALCQVNFEALIVPGNHPHYWIDDVEVETASSLALLAHRKLASANPVKRKKQLLLLGAPVEADKSFPALKHAAEEMDRVRSHFPAGDEKIFSGIEAVPQAYAASKPGDYRFIHVDAHSVASELNPLDSFVVLSPDAANSYKLYAHEIQDEPLHADLVTLSACYSAGTRWYNGEGIVGLGWAFLRAGAHQVMASLWAVDDASTPQLMDDFYGELSKGKSAAQSLHDAKLKMLHSGGQRSQPYYWASLQLYTGS